MKTGWQIAITEASSLQGKALVEALKESSLEIAALHLLTTEEHLENNVRIKGMTIPYTSLDSFDWQQVQILFLTEQVNLETIPAIVANALDAGCVVIDLSGTLAEQQNVPFFIPDVNNWVLENYRETNIIALPNALTCQLALTIQPLLNLTNIAQLSVTNLIPVSLFGQAGITELAEQSGRLLNGLPIENKDLFQEQIAFNLLPIDQHHLQANALLDAVPNQLRQVLESDLFDITVQGVIVPVFYANTQMVSLDAQLPIALEELTWRLSDNPVLQLHSQQPNPLQTVEQENKIHMGPLEYKQTTQQGIKFCTVADSLNFSCAALAVRSLELLSEIY